MIRRLGYYCRKILPTVLDDALSYYEQLCKVVLTCNACVDAVNGLTDTVGELNDRVANVDAKADLANEHVDRLELALNSLDEDARRIAVLAGNSVQKTNTPKVLYGTDDNGQKQYPIANGPVSFTVGLRDAGGVMRVGDPVNDYDAVNLKYLRENSGGSSAEMVLKKVRVSAPSGSGYLNIDVSDLAGIVANTPVWVTYYLPTGEFYGYPSYELSLGVNSMVGKKFGNYQDGISYEFFNFSTPFALNVFFDGTNFFVPCLDEYNTKTVAQGAYIRVGAQGSTVTGVAYADVVYFKEG